jgi:hypothetical protein
MNYTTTYVGLDVHKETRSRQAIVGIRNLTFVSYS